MSKNDTNHDGDEASFSQVQLEAISAVVEKVLKTGQGTAFGSGPSANGTADALGHQSHSPGNSEPGNSSGMASGE